MQEPEDKPARSPTSTFESDPTGVIAKARARARARQPAKQGHLFALMWAWLVGLFGKAPESEKTGRYTRVAYKRRGFRTWVQDLETHEQRCVRAESVPEAKMFCAALEFGARKMPTASAREVSDAAIELVSAAQAAGIQ